MTSPIESLNTQAAEAVPRSAAELEVLRVLWTHPGAPLVRSQIHKLMIEERRPTLGRVGQILRAFFISGLVERSVARAQGSRSASFYTLSGNGRRCAKEVGFVQKESLHFSVTEEQLAEHLSFENLCRSRAPGRILTLYGFRGGLGRTTATAFVAHGLAESLQGDDRLLSIDLDLSAPSLDRFLQTQEPRPSRGLAGLLIDYHLRPKAKRSLWLLAALREERYVVQTFSDRPLFFLPSGFSEREDLSASERAEAYTLLRQALKTHQTGSSGPGEDFLAELRGALLKSYRRTVIDCESGRSLGGWIATKILADELLIAAQYEDPSPSTRVGVRAVLADFLECQKQHAREGRFAVLLRADTSLEPGETVEWARKNLVEGNIPASVPRHAVAHCPVIPIESDRRLQTLKRLREAPKPCQHHDFWAPYGGRFQHLIEWLNADPAKSKAPWPAELQALARFLSPDLSPEGREIFRNQIRRWELRELIGWLNRYLALTESRPLGNTAADSTMDPEALTFLRSRLESLFANLLETLGGSGAGGSGLPAEKRSSKFPC